MTALLWYQPTEPAAGAAAGGWQPLNLQAVAFDDDRIDLTWDAVSEPGLAFYQVERNGTVIAEPTDPEYSDTGLDPDTEYEYRVRAVEEG